MVQNSKGMNNKELQKKILKEVYNKFYKRCSETQHQWEYDDKECFNWAIQFALAEKDTQKDLFVKKLKEKLLVGEDYDINDIEEIIDETNKEVFEDE